MGNALIRCFEGQEDHQGSRVQGGGGHYPYYQPQYCSHDPPASAAPRPHQQALGRHGVSPATPGGDALTQAAGPNIGHLQWSKGALANGVAASQYQNNTEDIDESSAEGLRDAKSYAKANPMLIQVPVLGTRRKFWRLSDDATRIIRKLALILRSQHSVGNCLAAPLQVSNVWIGSTGSVRHVPT
ncbi:hypothetical protein PVAP13_5NG341681 [Panicum virgatum]|uniref:Uncharacterized protein n=1 Tax=Panicum virgatum TaxID=38727 RepID=A0A8T0RVX8_PANVG|nr:hypothetical protein PVAP13_5NG341681 [Panicum virgatum]